MRTQLRLTSVRLWNKLLSLEQRWARQASQAVRGPIPTFADLNAWARHYLADYFTLPNSRFHDWLANHLRTLNMRRGTRLALVAPRGSAKSTWVSLVYPLWAAVHNQEPYILLISDSQGQARLLLEAIKRELEDNPLLAAAYPDAVGPGRPWGRDRLRLANGVVMEALGTGAKIRGRRNRADRPSVIIVEYPAT